METGYVFGNVDAAELAVYAFFIFFAGLVFYLQRESRREGYPLMERTGETKPMSWIYLPEPKVFKLEGGKEARSHLPDTRPVKAEFAEAGPGAPLIPTGNPMIDAVGPSSYADRADEPDMLPHGGPKIAPLRVATDYAVVEGDPDLMGCDVVGADNEVAGKVVDIWVDQGEAMIRYLELELPGGEMPRRKLLPMTFVRLGRERELFEVLVGPFSRDRGAYRVLVGSILSTQFDDVPDLAHPDQVTRLEEEKIAAYYGGGHLYAEPSRQEPLI